MSNVRRPLIWHRRGDHSTTTILLMPDRTERSWTPYQRRWPGCDGPSVSLSGWLGRPASSPRASAGISSGGLRRNPSSGEHSVDAPCTPFVREGGRVLEGGRHVAVD